MINFLKKIVIEVIKYRNYAKKLHNSEVFTIIKDPNKVFEVLYKIKEETWETMYAPAIFDASRERIIECKSPKQYIYQTNNAIVTVESDLILCDKGAWWDRYNDDDFYSCVSPYDYNLLSFDNKNLVAFHLPNRKYLNGRVLSLLGVSSQSWSHFLFQYICKLYFCGEAGLLDEPLTLLMNDYKDDNIEQLINEYLQNYPKVSIILAEQNTEYFCEKLIFTPSFTMNYGEVKYYLDYRYVTSSILINKIQEMVVKPLIERVKNMPVRHTKIFFSRHSNRCLNNSEEVESFFKQEGFFFVEGAELSLEEKADLFYHAEVVVGLHGTAWQNVIFCNGAKCLMLTNNRFVVEQIFYTMAKNNVSSWLNVAGRDDNETRRSNYTIPLDKIKRAYAQLLAE